MAKPKNGQNVTHGKSGRQGKVVGSSSSTIWVLFKGDSKPREVYGSSVHKSGCLVLVAVPVLVIAATIGGVYFGA